MFAMAARKAAVDGGCSAGGDGVGGGAGDCAAGGWATPSWLDPAALCVCVHVCECASVDSACGHLVACMSVCFFARASAGTLKRRHWRPVLRGLSCNLTLPCEKVPTPEFQEPIGPHCGNALPQS